MCGGEDDMGYDEQRLRNLYREVRLAESNWPLYRRTIQNLYREIEKLVGWSAEQEKGLQRLLESRNAKANDSVDLSGDAAHFPEEVREHIIELNDEHIRNIEERKQTGGV